MIYTTGHDRFATKLLHYQRNTTTSGQKILNVNEKQVWELKGILSTLNSEDLGSLLSGGG